MTTRFAAAGLALTLALTSSVHAGISFARGELVFIGSARVEADSNIFSNNSTVDDAVTTWTPSARFVRQAGVTTLDIGVGMAIVRFSDNVTEDTEDPYANFTLAYTPSPKSEFSTTISYKRNSRANEQVLARVESDDLQFSGTLRHSYSQKLGYRITVTGYDSGQLTAGYSDISRWNGNFDLMYEYSPKLFAVGGVTVVSSKTRGTPIDRVSPDSRDFSAVLGLEGELAAKVSGTIRAGYSWQDFDDPTIPKNDGAIINTNVTWKATETIGVRLFANRQFNVTPADQAITSLSFGASLDGKFYEQGFYSGTVSYEEGDYSTSGVVAGRSDSGYVFAGRLGWNFLNKASIEGGVNYRDMTSGLDVAEYKRTTWSVAARVQF